MEVSGRRGVLFIGALCLLVMGLIYGAITSEWPYPIPVALFGGFLYFGFTKMFMIDSGRLFALYNPYIDIPQTCFSGFLAFTGIKNQNPVMTIWLVDFVYHILEIIIEGPCFGK